MSEWWGVFKLSTSFFLSSYLKRLIVIKITEMLFEKIDSYKDNGDVREKEKGKGRAKS